LKKGRVIIIGVIIGAGILFTGLPEKKIPAPHTFAKK
jgi:hypothetical protein